MGYNVEAYWSRVGREVGDRSAENVVAGDDNPFYRYKRQKFLRTFLHRMPFTGQRVLEIGCGPGGNLAEIAHQFRPAALIGADISPVMVDLARRRLGDAASIHHIDGATLPFADRSVDLSFTVTVLQHNVDGARLTALVAEIARVTASQIVLMEDVGHGALHGGGTFVARRVEVYRDLLGSHGFTMRAHRLLGTRVSHRMHRFSRGFWPTGLAYGLLSITQPVTRVLDRFAPERGGFAQMVFERRP
jgi:SAM-dependent methyltransferase